MNDCIKTIGYNVLYGNISNYHSTLFIIPDER